MRALAWGIGAPEIILICGICLIIGIKVLTLFAKKDPE